MNASVSYSQRPSGPVGSYRPARSAPGWVPSDSVAPRRAFPGPVVDLSPQEWLPGQAVSATVARRSAPANARARRACRTACRVVATTALSAVVLAVPTGAAVAAAQVLKPPSDVSTQHVPGERPKGPGGPIACCTSAR